jgi:hypothetical protein
MHEYDISKCYVEFVRRCSSVVGCEKCATLQLSLHQSLLLLHQVHSEHCSVHYTFDESYGPYSNCRSYTPSLYDFRFWSTGVLGIDTVQNPFQLRPRQPYGRTGTLEEKDEVLCFWEF